MRRVTKDVSRPPEARVEVRKTTMFGNTHAIFDRYRRWRRYRQTVRELQNLSTRELSDLGIFRGDISRLARDATRL